MKIAIIGADNIGGTADPLPAPCPRRCPGRPGTPCSARPRQPPGFRPLNVGGDQPARRFVAWYRRLLASTQPGCLW